jgi:uncharacterized protein (TIGR02266 family)
MAGPHDPGDDAAIEAEDDFAEVTSERRGEVRCEATLRVEYQSLDELVVAYTADVGARGVFVATGDLLPVGTIVHVELQLPEGGPMVRAVARVAHTRDGERSGMGMEFLDGDASLASKLAEYVAISLDRESAAAVDPASFVLVVDDDLSCRNQAATVMRKRGHRVEAAQNGLEALGMVLRDPPDLIITDVQMPIMDGWQLLRVLRARPSLAHIPVIFLTQLSGEAERLKGYKLGVDDYIPKPFLFEELAARVARVFARGRSRAALRNALRGDLAQVSLASVLQLIELEKRTGLLLVVSAERLATLHVRDGVVVHVDFGAPCAEPGFDRLLRVLDWSEGRFELTSAEVTTEDSVGETIAFALLEHARRRDEAG